MPDRLTPPKPWLRCARCMLFMHVVLFLFCILYFVFFSIFILYFFLFSISIRIIYRNGGSIMVNLNHKCSFDPITSILHYYIILWRSVLSCYCLFLWLAILCMWLMRLPSGIYIPEKGFLVFGEERTWQFTYLVSVEKYKIWLQFIAYSVHFPVFDYTCFMTIYKLMLAFIFMHRFSSWCSFDATSFFFISKFWSSLMASLKKKLFNIYTSGPFLFEKWQLIVGKKTDSIHIN